MRNLVTKLLDNRLVYVLVSLVAAFILWLWVVNAVNPSDTRNVSFSVHYEGIGVIEAYDLRLASNTPDRVVLRVEASVADLNRLEQNAQLIVDVSGIREAGEHDVVFHFAAFNIMPSTINYRPLGAVSNTHNTIIVRTNRITGRTFSLGMEGVSYALAETDEEDYFFVRERQSVYPETIQIDGPAEILDRIAFIEVESRFVAPLTDTTTQAGSLRIYDIDGDRIPPEDLADVLLPDGTQLAYASVSATVVVRMVRMVQLRPVFEPGAGASEENISYRLSQETVRLIGDSEVLRGLPYLELAQIRLDRVGLVDSIRLDIPIPGLTEILDGPEHVDVEIQILDVVEREMTIPRSRILIAGEPEGMNAVVELDTITLIIRGPADTLEELDESDISVLVNLADYVGQTGRFLVEDFMVLVDDWPTYVVGARNRQGQGIVVNLQRNS